MFAELGLHDNLAKALERLELKTATPIQQQMIPVALAGKDVQACARTGSGKSAAFLLPILHQMLASPSPRTATRCLVISPTRELALQLDRHCRELARFTDITSLVIVGGEGLKPQQAKIRKNPEIIIGTPGRLLEHVQKKSLELGDLEFLVFDEVDRILDMGFRDDVLAIVAACRAERQTLMLSATLDHGELKQVAAAVQKAPVVLKVDDHRSSETDIQHEIILADDPAHKRQLCSWLLANEPFKQALVFSNTREYAEELAAFLIKQGHRTVCLHGEMQQSERKKVMQLYRDGKFAVMVATDLAARGLDIPTIDLVINFAMARSGDDYVHRTGRTGRAGASGRAVSLIAPQEWNLMESIARYLNLTFSRREIQALPARFSGPVKKKKPKKADKKHKGARTKGKAKERHRNRKNIGKRRQASVGETQKAESKKTESTGSKKTKVADKKAQAQTDSAGLAPLTRK